MADIFNIDSGNPIYNGAVTLNTGAGDPTYFEHFRDRAITTPVIADIDDKYDDKFDDITYYTLGS